MYSLIGDDGDEDFFSIDNLGAVAVSRSITSNSKDVFRVSHFTVHYDHSCLPAFVCYCVPVFGWNVFYGQRLSMDSVCFDTSCCCCC